MARPRIGAERREEILVAFEACVARKGLAKTTLVDVAEQAGQPRPLVRYFIGNRDAMVTALIDRLLERGEAQFRRLPIGSTAERVILEIAALIDGPHPHDRAFCAVALALGAAFFRHLGLAVPNPANVHGASHRLLRSDFSAADRILSA